MLHGTVGHADCLCKKIVRELFDGSCTMTDLVFHFHTQFGKSLPHTFGYEHWVVAKALRAAFLPRDSAFHNTFKEILAAIFFY